MENIKEVIENLLLYKLENGMTNKELASQLDCNDCYLARVFQGHIPGPKLVFRIRKLIKPKPHENTLPGQGSYKHIT